MANPKSPRAPSGPAPSPLKATLLPTLAVLARWLLGGLFIYMGLNKALHPEVFLKLVRQYEMVGSPFVLNLIAASLPWFEVFCGVLLVLGVAVRGTALMLLAMLGPFTGIVLHRALAIADAQHLAFCAVKFDCGCGTGEVLICRKLVENCLLMLLSAWLLTGSGRRLCAWFTLWRTASPEREAVPEPGVEAGLASQKEGGELAAPGSTKRL